MWCVNCQHGHEPIDKLDAVTGKVRKVCPCCGVILDPTSVKTKEELLAEYASKLGLEVSIGKKDKGTVIGAKEPKKENMAEKARQAYKS